MECKCKVFLNTCKFFGKYGKNDRPGLLPAEVCPGKHLKPGPQPCLSSKILIFSEISLYCTFFLFPRIGNQTLCYFCGGEMAEWSIAAVLKTVRCNSLGGSNPSLSALTHKASRPFGGMFLFASGRTKLRFSPDGCKQNPSRLSLEEPCIFRMGEQGS